MIVGWIDEARAAGARLRSCCRELGLDTRTVQRWKAQDIGDDRRHGPKTTPANKLSQTERRELLTIANSAAYRDKSPKQIVPLLADQGLCAAFIPLRLTGVTWLLSIALLACGAAGSGTGGQTNQEGPRVRVPETGSPTQQATVRALAAGEEFTCAIADGCVFCWGNNSVWQLGTFGSGVTPSRVDVPESMKVDAGPYGACVITVQGETWCWGAVGHEEPTQPRLIGATPAAIDIAVGHFHVCIVDEAGIPWCWGYGPAGALGRAVSPQFANAPPARVSGAPVVESISCDATLTCGLAADSVKCWGRDRGGNGGQVPVAGTHNLTQVELDDIASVDVGVGHTCALRNSGDVWCWGQAQHGQLEPAARRAGEFALIDLPEPAVAVSAGGFHSCAIGQSGRVYCWGNNEMGQFPYFDEPRGLRMIALPATATLISVGSQHACAATVDGAIYCWGDNEANQLAQPQSSTKAIGQIRLPDGSCRSPGQTLFSP